MFLRLSEYLLFKRAAVKAGNYLHLRYHGLVSLDTESWSTFDADSQSTRLNVAAPARALISALHLSVGVRTPPCPRGADPRNRYHQDAKARFSELVLRNLHRLYMYGIIPYIYRRSPMPASVQRTARIEARLSPEALEIIRRARRDSGS